MKVNLPNDSKKYLTGETGITERSLDAHKRLTPHLNLIRFQPVMYELTYDEKYALWLLYSKEKGYTFLPLDKVPDKEFDDFITFWVETHTKIN